MALHPPSTDFIRALPADSAMIFKFVSLLSLFFSVAAAMPTLASAAFCAPVITPVTHTHYVGGIRLRSSQAGTIVGAGTFGYDDDDKIAKNPFAQTVRDLAQSVESVYTGAFQNSALHHGHAKDMIGKETPNSRV